MENRKRKREEKHFPLCMSPPKQPGEVRVAKYYPGRAIPRMENFKTILIHTSPHDIGGPLSPYLLKNEEGQLLENVWQFSKLYPSISAQKIPLSRYHPNIIIWQHPQEDHIEKKTNEPLEAYWAWREKGMNNRYAVRYPNGFYGRKKCVCSIWRNASAASSSDSSSSIVFDSSLASYQRLGYIDARKVIYCGEYIRLAPKTEAIKHLQSLHLHVQNLLIVEVDGPDPTLNYPPYNQISTQSPGLLISDETIRILVNDPRKPFGHGYVIASLILSGASWME
jgi:hypothetical protein